MARLALAVATVGWLVIGGLVSLPTSADGAPSSAEQTCGSKRLYGKKLEIRVVGKPVPCSRVRQIIRGACRPARDWSCFSFQTPDPVLVWFRESERFNPSWTTTIEARRRPCEESELSAETWSVARRAGSAGFPTRMQVLADDAVRCRLLDGLTYRQVIALLGRPTTSEVERGRRYIDYELGPERDSFLQLDSEFLTITFDRRGILAVAELAQG